jgi:hypothetical protein
MAYRFRWEALGMMGGGFEPVGLCDVTATAGFILSVVLSRVEEGAIQRRCERFFHTLNAYYLTKERSHVIMRTSVL